MIASRTIAEFEEWALDRGLPLKASDGKYIERTTETAFQAWLAATHIMEREHRRQQ